MVPAAKTLRRLALAALTGGAVVLAVPAAGGILSGFKNSLIEFALDQISVPDALEIQAEEIDDPEEGFTRLTGVTIADKNGVWMTIGSLTVDWNVSRVLRGELELNSLVAQDVDVLRQPNPEDVEVEVKEGSELDRSVGGLFDWPRSPITTRIEEMRLDDVFIAEGVIAGPSIRFNASGSARDEGDEQSVRLDVDRIDGIDGSIDFEYLRTFDANTLMLQLAAQEEPGGLVAALFGLPNDAASRMLIDADGPLSDWRLTFDAGTTDIFEAEGSAVVSTDQPFTVRAEFALDPGPNMSPRLRRVLAPQATLTVAIEEDEAGVIRIEEAAIRSPEIKLEASGAFDRNTSAVDLDMALAVEAGLAETIEGLSLGRFTFEGNVEGTTDDLTATGALNLSRFATERFEVDDAELQASVEVAGPRIAATIDGQVAGMRLDRLTREQLGTAEIAGGVVYENEIVTLNGFSIDSPLLSLGASGTVDLATDQADLSYRLSSDELGEIARTYEVDAAGALSVEGTVQGSLSAPRLAGNAALTDLVYAGQSYGQVALRHDVELGEEPHGSIDLAATGSAIGPAEIDTAFVLTADNLLRLTEMTAQALGITAEGRATVQLDDQLVAGDLAVDATDLSELADFLGTPISGGARGALQLTVADGEQNAAADLTLDDFYAAGLRIGSGSLDIAVEDALGTPGAAAKLDVGDIDMAGFDIGRVSGSVDLPAGEGVAEVALNVLDVEGAGIAVPSARVGGTVTDPFGAPSLDLDLSVASIDGSVSSSGISGTIVSTAALAQVDIDVVAMDFAAAEGSADRLVVDAAVIGLDRPEPARIEADLVAEGLVYQDAALGRFAGQVATTEALEAVELDAALTGPATPGPGDLSVGTATFDGVVRDPLGEPKIDADLTVADFAFRDQRIGRLTGRVDTSEDGAAMRIDLTLDDFALMEAAGSRAVLEGTVREPFSDLPKPDLDLRVEELSYQGVRMGTLAGTLDASEDGERIAFDLSLSGVEGEGLTVDAAEVSGAVTDPLGRAAIDVDLTVRDLAYQDVTLDVLSGQVRTTPERDRITLDVTLERLEGQGVQVDSARIDGAVLDPFGQPKPTGQITARGIAYGDQPVGDLTGSVATAEDASRIDIDIRLEGAARAVIDATIRDPYGQPLVDADIDVADLRLGDLARIDRIDGEIATTGDAEAVDVDLELAGIDAAGLRIEAATVDGTVTDPFGDLGVTATVNARGFAYGDEIRIGSLDGAITSLDGLDRIDLDVTASDFSGYGVRFAEAQVDGILTGALGDPGFQGEIAAESFAYGDELAIRRIAGTVAAEPGLGSVEIDAGFRGLAGYGLDIGAGQVNGVVTDPMGQIGFTGELGAESLAYGDAVSVGRLSGVVAAAPGLGEIDLDVNVSELEAYGATVVSGDVTGVLTDPTGDPRFDGEVRARQIGYGDYRIERVAAETDVTEGGDRVEATISLTGLSGGGARLASAQLQATVENALADPVIRAELTARNAGFQGNEAAQLTARVTITDVTGAPAVQGTATASGISAAGATIGTLDLDYDLADVAGSPTGTVRGTGRNVAVAGIQAERAEIAARLTESGGRTRVVADLDLRDVDLGPATVELLAIDATVDDALGANPVLSIEAESSAADLGFARLGGALFSAGGPLSALNVGLSTEGERLLGGQPAQPLSFEFEGRLDLSRGLAGQISRLELSLGDDRFGLNAPLVLDAAGGATRLSGLDIAIPGGVVTGDVALYGNGIAGDILVRISDPRPLGELAALPEATGMLTLAAEFDTRPGRAEAVVALDGEELRFADAETGIGALTLDFDLVWDGRTAQNELTLAGDFGQPVRARLMLPLRPTGGLLPAVPANAAIDGSLVWEGDIGAFWPLVPLPDHVLDGPVKVDLRVSGPIAGPQVSGEVSMLDGRYENLEFGTILTDLTITSEIRSADTFALNFTASDGADAVVSGRAAIGPAGLDAAIGASDAILVRRDDVTAMLTLDVTAAGPLNALRIAGDIRIDRAEVRLVNLTPPTVVTLGDVRIKGERRVAPEPSASTRITLDLSVAAPDDIFIRGRGLDSEWEAALAISGTAAEPRIAGEIERIRGELTLLGRDFDLEEGEIDFGGGADIDPRLNVRLVRDSDDISGGIWVHGLASDPQIEFFSRPALPEDEVLPRVLFGRSKQSLSPVEAVQLAAGVATLLDGTGGALDDIRNTLGVDVLRVDGAGDAASVTVGRNVADDVFVGVKQPIGGGQASVEVEIEVFDNIDVRSEVGGEKGSSVGVQWKKDF